MNLDDLHALHNAATPGPWPQVPTFFNPRGVAVLSGPNAHLIRTFRTLLPEILALMEATNTKCHLHNLIVAEAKHCPVSEESRRVYRDADIEILKAHTALVLAMRDL